MNRFQIKWFCVFCFCLGLNLALVEEITSAQDSNASSGWMRFRGNNADGLAPDNPKLPETWSKTKNVKWTADVPGYGWSCPIVVGDRVFLTAVVGDEENVKPKKGLYLGEGVRDPLKGVHHWMVYCFDLNSGKTIWKQEAHTGRPPVPRHPKSSYAAETPTSDGERLFVVFGDVGIYCYDLDGKPIWSETIEPKKTMNDWGAASSPVVHDGKVIVVYDNLESSWIASLDAKSGKEVWKKNRDETHSWSTPYVWENDVRTEIVVSAQKKYRGYSLSGEVLWEFDGKGNLVIPSPFSAHGLCFLASGYFGAPAQNTFAIKPGAKGDLAPDTENYTKNDSIAWHTPRSAPYNTTQLVYGDYLYTLYDRGFFTCHEAKTGKEVYGKQRLKPRGSFTASPWAYNGKIFCLNEDGLTYTIQPGPEFKVLETSDLDELSLSTPAIVGDKLLIRTASKLYCLSDSSE